MASSGTRFKINGTVYAGQSIEDITLADAIMFDSYAAEAGWGVTLDQVEEMAAKDSLTIRESLIVTAVTVWLMRRAAGEDITLKDAAAVKASAIEEMPAAGDRKAPKAKKKPSSPKASAAAGDGVRPDVVQLPTSPPTSASA
jgi:hypothetical protein